MKSSSTDADAYIRIYGDRTEAGSWHFGFQDNDMQEFRVIFGDDYYELENDFRYYGPGYERGPWPLLALAMMKASARWPEAIIYYGPGGAKGFAIVDGPFLMEMWSHYFGPHGNDYYEGERIR